MPVLTGQTPLADRSGVSVDLGLGYNWIMTQESKITSQTPKTDIYGNSGQTTADWVEFYNRRFRDMMDNPDQIGVYQGEGA